MTFNSIVDHPECVLCNDIVLIEQSFNSIVDHPAHNNIYLNLSSSFFQFYSRSSTDENILQIVIKLTILSIL